MKCFNDFNEFVWEEFLIFRISLVERVFISVGVSCVRVVDSEFLFFDGVYEVNCGVSQVWSVYMVSDYIDFVVGFYNVVFEVMFVEEQLILQF